MVKTVLIGCLIALALCVPSSASSRLFPKHGAVELENSYAEKAGIPRLTTRRQIEAGLITGYLVPIPIAVCPRLPEFRRAIRPAAAAFMLELDTRFYLVTGRFLVVDSAVRSADIQRQVARHNRSAAPANGDRASSHERGTTFDLAKRDFSPSGRYDRLTRGQYRWLLIQLAYYQGIGRIHVIEERACLHIMVREDEGSQQVIPIAGVELMAPVLVQNIQPTLGVFTEQSTPSALSEELWPF